MRNMSQGVSPETLYESLGEGLRLLRSRRHLKQGQVAEMAGITKAMLSAYETGAHLPTIPTLSAILIALETDFSGLQEALNALRDVAAEGGRERGQPNSHALTGGESNLAAVLVLELRRFADSVELLARQSPAH